MIGKALIAIYLFSAIYCFIQIDSKIHKAMELFLDRHPEFPIGRSGVFESLGVYIKIGFVSAIPIVNLLLAFFLENASATILEDVVRDVEMKYLEDRVRSKRKNTNEETKE